MNRLVIVGNGFDRAHNLPTSYNHFINDFWKNLKENYKKEEFKEIVFINEMYFKVFDYIKPVKTYDDFIQNLEKYSEEYGFRFIEKEQLSKNLQNVYLFKFENIFFKTLNKRRSIHNWVDIENEYYKELKKISKIENYDVDYKTRAVEKLNKEFDQVKILLEKYLREKVIDSYHFGHDSNNREWVKIQEILKPISLLNNESNLFKEFSNDEDTDSIEEIFNKEKKGDFSITPTGLYFLNFNYTPTLTKYFNILKEQELYVQINHIHGEVENSNNPINFGFGDEMDEDYKLIENLNENEFLKNFKSFQYLQNSNYNKLLSYIDSDKFQVFIIGHSCGLSDRTLLNTIFEHKNCRSIKVFYHDEGDKNNYTDIIQNISRHFDDKKIMREKIVNKSLCKPFPQIQLSKR